MTLQLYSSVLYTEIKHLIIIAHFEPMPKSCLHHAAAAGYPKGQLISECLFDVLNFPKKQRKI